MGKLNSDGGAYIFASGLDKMLITLFDMKIG